LKRRISGPVEVPTGAFSNATPTISLAPSRVGDTPGTEDRKFMLDNCRPMSQ